MSASTCPYCQKDESLAAFAIEIAQLSPASTLYLFREQSHPGRLVVAYNGHVSELIDLDEAQRNAFMADVARAAKALHAAYKPAKVNYAAYGDLNPHLHFHLVPKYKDDFEWGGTFVMNPQKTILSDAEYAATVEKIRAAL